MFLHRRTIATSPLMQAKSTPRQRTLQQRVMDRFNARDMAVVFIIMLAVRAVTSYHNWHREALVSQLNQSSSSLIPSPPERQLHLDIPPFRLNHWTDYSTIQRFYSGPVMPRI